MQASLNDTVINDNLLAALSAVAGPADLHGGASIGHGSGGVYAWSVDPANYGSGHEKVTRRSHARRLAHLKGLHFAGELEASSVASRPAPSGSRYYVPSDTVVGCDVAHAMGIRSEADLFGGVVPLPYVSTKAISHPLHGDATAPEGWVSALAPRIRQSVLDGYTAFSEVDARRAGRWLLRGGDVRIKPVRATGGCGQTVAVDAQSLDALLAEVPGITVDGVVLERNLRSPRTLSVGQVTVGDLRISYYGLQRLTRNHDGEWVYGGSDLTCVRGDLDTLHALPKLATDLRLAIDQARAYHAAVIESFPGFMASRINYDVAQGCDDSGRWCSGVLEQSWRIGGASGAEISALETFREQPERQLVRASCVEVFGEPTLPPGAFVSYNDTDPVVGRLTKYSFVEPHADAT